MNMNRFQRRQDESRLQGRKLDKLVQFLNEKSAPKRPTLQACSESGDLYELSLPYDMLFTIFVLLPAESLCRMQFVCKKWFEMINSSLFIEFHRQQSETVLISRVQLYDAYTFRLTGDSGLKPYFHFLEFERGQDNFVASSLISSVEVKASYDGLVLGEIKNQSLILTNPVTRKHKSLPSGTIGFKECYGLTFCSKERSYKVVHLFRESAQYSGCEIFCINTEKWTVIDGPSSNLLQDITLSPVAVGGSLYWMPRIHGVDQILSLNVEEEKFLTIKLPIVCTLNDRLVEIGGALGFATHAALHLIQVWILTKAGEGAEHWVKRYSVYLHFDARSVIPVCSWRNGRGMVFEFPGNDLYLYDFEKDSMKQIYSREDDISPLANGAEHQYIPHRNTLVSWNHHDSS